MAGRRPFPELESFDLDLLAKKRPPFGGVIATEWSDLADERVFAAVFAVQDIDGQRWLVRAVLRTTAGGPPVLSRVAVEHFHDPSREVRGATLRDLRLGSIRDQALERLRERGTNLAAMSFVPDAAKAAARDAARAAGKIPIGPRGAYPVDHYRHIAKRYLALVASGRRDVLNALAEEEAQRLDEPIGRERIRDWVKKATRMEFLAPGRPGMTGRLPGPNLKSKGENDG